MQVPVSKWYVIRENGTILLKFWSLEKKTWHMRFKSQLWLQEQIQNVTVLYILLHNHFQLVFALSYNFSNTHLSWYCTVVRREHTSPPHNKQFKITRSIMKLPMNGLYCVKMLKTLLQATWLTSQLTKAIICTNVCLPSY